MSTLRLVNGWAQTAHVPVPEMLWFPHETQISLGKLDKNVRT